MIRIIEIHAAEGGDDAKLLTADLAKAYQRFFDRKG
jgi:protein subunit release factor A